MAVVSEMEEIPKYAWRALSVGERPEYGLAPADPFACAEVRDAVSSNCPSQYVHLHASLPMAVYIASFGNPKYTKCGPDGRCASGVIVRVDLEKAVSSREGVAMPVQIINLGSRNVCKKAGILDPDIFEASQEILVDGSTFHIISTHY